MESKDKIKETLKNFGRVSSSRIAGILGWDYNHTLKLLGELFEEGEIEKVEETTATYWEIKPKEE